MHNTNNMHDIASCCCNFHVLLPLSLHSIVTMALLYNNSTEYKHMIKSFTNMHVQVHDVSLVLSNPWDRDIEIDSISLFTDSEEDFVSVPCAIVLPKLIQVWLIRNKLPYSPI